MEASGSPTLFPRFDPSYIWDIRWSAASTTNPTTLNLDSKNESPPPSLSPTPTLFDYNYDSDNHLTITTLNHLHDSTNTNSNPHPPTSTMSTTSPHTPPRRAFFHDVINASPLSTLDSPPPLSEAGTLNIINSSHPPSPMTPRILFPARPKTQKKRVSTAAWPPKEAWTNEKGVRMVGILSRAVRVSMGEEVEMLSLRGSEREPTVVGVPVWRRYEVRRDGMTVEEGGTESKFSTYRHFG